MDCRVGLRPPRNDEQRGVTPQHLVAAGFGEFQPIDLGETEEAYRRNRRIELKLTER
jgi:chemotaxis protein MotB